MDVPFTNSDPSNNNHSSLKFTDRHPAECSYCQRTFLFAQGDVDRICPLCRLGSLEPQPNYAFNIQPIQILPFKIAPEKLSLIYSNFISPVKYKPVSMNTEALLNNTRAIFWPYWVVDGDVNGSWLTEAGFDYQVESAKESLSARGWQSKKEIQTRIRWEDRLGQMATHMDNIITPALEEQTNRIQMTGDYHLDRAKDFESMFVGVAHMQLPDISPDDAWSSAIPTFEHKVANTCREAAGAQHLRNFLAEVRFTNQKWTQLFLPMYTTYYTDDDEKFHILVVNGETGVIQGPRIASPAQSGYIAGVIGAISGGLFFSTLISLILSLKFPDISFITGILAILSFIGLITALAVSNWSKQWNKMQTGPRIENKLKSDENS